jgi:hypothetical protein
MSIWLPVMLMSVIGGFGFRLWYRARRRRKAAAARRVEAPNSHYSSAGVRNLEDRERWGEINLGVLHPLNQEEVGRLLVVVDADGIRALSGKDRLFLDNMTVVRAG